MVQRKLSIATLVIFSACAGKTLSPVTENTAPPVTVVNNTQTKDIIPGAQPSKKKRFGRSLASADDAAAANPHALPHVIDDLIVQFRSGTTEAGKGRAFGRVNGKRSETLFRGKSGKGDLELIKFKGPAGVTEAIQEITSDPAVEFAEPNWIVKHTDVSNDTYYTNGNLWGMYGDNTTPMNPFGSRAAKAWASNSNCSDVVVGIIDEGYMHTHTDLAANAYKNPGEIAGNGKDDDGNGYIDDVQGWDFNSNDKTVFDGVDDDHGTHVAGTIGAVGGNGTGVAGVCWSVKIMNAKFLGKQGGTIANAIKAVDYFTDLKTRHNLNLVATNNSWGGGGFSQGLSDAITRANQAEILFIAAAGNDNSNNDAVIRYPSGNTQDNVIAVAALTSAGTLATYSNYGATQVDLGAPGSGIWSTVPTMVKRKIVAGYANYSGTSMATPHVTGAAALYRAHNPGATAAQIKAALLAGTPTPSLQGKTLTGNRLNVENF